MIKSYDENNEIREIVKSLNSLPDYQGYQYDQELGFHKGPQSNDDPIIPILTSNEAIIGLREPIPKMAQHHLLLVEKGSSNNWKIKKILQISEK